MGFFAVATLTPVVLLVLGALLGGPWVWAGVAYITVFSFSLDRLIQGQVAQRGTSGDFPTGVALSVTLALMHLPLLLLVVWAVAGGDALSPTDRAGMMIAGGLFFGQISHPNAHELIHRARRGLQGLGVMTYATLLMGHHVSAHRLVHHVHVGTQKDPNSAPKGMGFWRFALRAWVGSLRAGSRAETALRARSRRSRRNFHPYFTYALHGVISISLSITLKGMPGLWALLAVAVYAQIQVLLADYVQHYGLRRGLSASGRLQPFGPAHAWNSPHLFSSAMMLNAPRHSDHHLHPSRHYPGLRLTPGMPVLPYPLPVMAVIALLPPVWRRVMDPKLAQVLADTAAP